MIRNYLKIALRNLRKNKGFSVINILGLAIGMACCILILLFVRDELAFDSFHSNADRIYRLNKIVTPQTGGTEFHAITSGLMGPTMVTDFPEVEQCVRVLPWFSDVLMTHGDISLKMSDVVFADSNFFDVFDFKLFVGDKRTALVAPMSVVLSRQMARAFFGEQDPVGKLMTGLNDLQYIVTGVIEDAPRSSHLQYNALISWSSTLPGRGGLEFEWLNRWITQVNFSYLLLTPAADWKSLSAKFSDFMKKYMPSRSDQYELYLQPFSDIYLHSSDVRYSDRVRLGNIFYVYVFSTIALLSLFIACINFMNLSTARATRRAREVGVRKVLGAYRLQLGKQFFGESLLLSFLALLIAVVVVEIALPYFNTFTGKSLQFDFLSNPLLFLSLSLLTILVGVFSGLYPAFLLSGFRPVQVIKGLWSGDGRGELPRKILVTVQFCISIGLIVATGIVYKQLQFTQSKNLGFQKDQILILPIGDSNISNRAEVFKQELLENPNITHIAGSNSVPGLGMMSFGLRPEGKPDTEEWMANAMRIDDFDFPNTYGIEIADGRYFSANFETDKTNAIVINEALAKSLGWDNAIGKRLDIGGEVDNGTVIGVLKDFHMRSLHHPIEPMAIYFAPRWENLSVRLSGQGLAATISFLKEKWQAFEPTHPFEYYFLDQKFADFYRSEQKMMMVFGLFSILAISIACLGLFGLAAFSAEQRTKEIGIRKVLGATVGGVVVLLSREFAKLIMLGFLVASPIAFILMTKWLNNFSFRTDIGADIFVLSGVIAIMIALLSVSYQAIKAALLNPVKALRYE